MRVRRISLLIASMLVSVVLVATGASAVARSTSARVAKPDPTGTVRLAASITPTKWNPHTGTSDAVNYTFMSPVYDQLFQFDNKLVPQPSVATGYELSADKKSITIKLRKDVKFWDGTALNAAAVITNLNYSKSVNNSINKAFYDTMAAATAVDEWTVKLDMTTDASTVPLSMATQISVGGVVNPKVIAENRASLDTTPAGSGPFKLTSQTQDRAVYDKAPQYWDHKLFKRLPQHLELIAIVDDNALVAALQGGQIDAAMIRGPIPNKASIVDGRKIKEWRSSISNRLLLTYVNLSNPALAKPEVREALSMAIDRKAIGKLALGSCEASAIPFAPGGVGYTPKGKIAFDQARAKKLLNDAGFQTLSFKMSIVDGGAYSLVATAMQAQWAKIGVNVDITVTPSSLTQAEWRSGKYDLALRSAQGNPDPKQMVGQYFVANPVNQPFGDDPKLTALANQAAALPYGSKERDKAYQGVAEYIAKTPFTIVNCYSPPTVWYRSNLVGVEDQGWGQIQASFDPRRFAIIKS